MQIRSPITIRFSLPTLAASMLDASTDPVAAQQRSPDDTIFLMKIGNGPLVSFTLGQLQQFPKRFLRFARPSSEPSIYGGAGLADVNRVVMPAFDFDPEFEPHHNRSHRPTLRLLPPG